MVWIIIDILDKPKFGIFKFYGLVRHKINFEGRALKLATEVWLKLNIKIF